MVYAQGYLIIFDNNMLHLERFFDKVLNSIHFIFNYLIKVEIVLLVAYIN